jgi:hypothetical protein
MKTIATKTYEAVLVKDEIMTCLLLGDGRDVVESSRSLVGVRVVVMFSKT